MSGSCLTPRTIVRTYPQAPCPPAVDEECSHFPKWIECKTCCSDGSIHTGYNATDGILEYCHEGQTYLVESLTEEANCDNPFSGQQKMPPTWKVTTLPNALNALKGKQDALRDCDGKTLTAGTKVPSCDEVCDLVKELDDKKQDTLMGCDGKALAADTKVPSCDAVDEALAEKQNKLKSCGGSELGDKEVVACDQMGEGIVWDEESGTWVVDSDCGPGYMCLPNGCGTILWGYAVITADRTVHKVELPVTLNAAVDPSQTSVTITDFGDSKQVDGQLIDDGDTANLTSRQSNSDLSWVSMLDNPESSIGIYEVKSNTDSLPSKTVTWVMMTNRTCA